MIVDVIVIVDGDGDGDGDGDEPSRPTKHRRPSRADRRRMLSFQRLDVYRVAIEFLAEAVEITAKVPRGYASLADQLRRAATSCPLNIAEGAGRSSDADAARHYGIARGSAMECAAVLDALKVLGAVEPARYERGMELLEREVAMLTKLCR